MVHRFDFLPCPGTWLIKCLIAVNWSNKLVNPLALFITDHLIHSGWWRSIHVDLTLAPLATSGTPQFGKPFWVTFVVNCSWQFCTNIRDWIQHSPTTVNHKRSIEAVMITSYWRFLATPMPMQIGHCQKPKVTVDRLCGLLTRFETGV